MKALYGFKVEEWDWKKMDICSDVIHESSPAVREVSLYSSGNNAVLMGWASEEGLGNRKKFPLVSHARVSTVVEAKSSICSLGSCSFKRSIFMSKRYVFFDHF